MSIVAETIVKHEITRGLCACAEDLGELAAGGSSWSGIVDRLRDEIYKALVDRPDAARALAELVEDRAASDGDEP